MPHPVFSISIPPFSPDDELDGRRGELTGIPVSGMGSVFRNCDRKSYIKYKTMAKDLS